MPAAPAPVEPPVAEFLDRLAKSRLLPPGHPDPAAVAPPSARGRAAGLADHLVAAGSLTRFQADKLLAGRWQGLAVGPYRLLYPIGRGGMGVVYLGRDADGRLVAVKVLPPGRAKAEPRTLARFRREAAVGTALPPHPHLTRTLAGGTADGVHFLAMEYVPGRTVREAVAAGGPLAVGTAARLFADVAAGLAAAHAAGFVHRDLKPGNVIATPDGRGKLLDFGFALRLGEPTPDDPAVLGGPGHTVGTMDYLPPEQARDAAGVGPAADLYALGCSLYFAVGGGPPFPGGTARDKIRWHRQEVPPPITAVNPAVPAEFDRLVGWLMAKRPQDRPPSAAEAFAHLAAWADPPPPPPPPPADGDLVAVVAARWHAAQGRHGADADESSTAPADASPTAPPPTASAGVRLPWWLVGLAAGLVAAAFALGLVVAAGLR